MSWIKSIFTTEDPSKSIDLENGDNKIIIDTGNATTDIIVLVIVGIIALAGLAIYGFYFA